MAGMMLGAAAFFSLVNALLVLGLLVVYVGSYRKVRAEFTAGLVFFSAIFLVQNLLAVYSYVAMFMYFAAGVGGLVLAISVTETAGLAVLLWMSVR